MGVDRMSLPIIIKVTPQSYRVAVTPAGILVGTNLSMTTHTARFVEYDYNNFTRRWVVARKYRYYNTKTQELYLPVYDLPRFIELLDKEHISWKTVFLPLTAGKPVEILLQPGVAPRDELQAQAIDYLVTDTAPVRGLALQTGKGKALPLDTPIKTPGGWSMMGSIKLGDQVIAADGTATEVVGVYPQGTTPTYRMLLEDGRYVDSHGEHLWKIFSMDGEIASGWSVSDTVSIQQHLETKSASLYLPLCSAEEVNDTEVACDPYTFGRLLCGDGTLNTDVEYDKTDLFDPLFEKLQSIFSDILGVGEITNTSGKYIYSKRIPDVYMRGSYTQKLKLLQGLMDASGIVDIAVGCIMFRTTSKMLCEQVQCLVWSIGGIAKVTQEIFASTDNLFSTELVHIVTIRMQHLSQLFCWSTEKHKAKQYDNGTETLKLKIISVTTHIDQPTQCIKVSHPDSLFVIKDYLVTHNTASLLMSLSRIGLRSMIVLPGLIEQWQRAIGQFTMLTEDDVYLIQGQQSVFKLMSGIDKRIFPKIILCSISTLRNYALDKEGFVNCPNFDQLCDVWNVGVRVTDEIHLNFHANLLMDLRLTPANTICLTATFDNSKPDIKTIFDSHYPVTMRYGENVYHRYVDVYAYAYSTGVGDIPIKAYKGEKGYSQIRWETWLLKQGRHKLRQITEDVYMPLIRAHYIHRKLADEKCLILCDTVEMCRFFLRECQQNFPECNSAIYISETEDSVLDTAQIIISTPKSAGTGRDIKNLLTVVTTTSVRSAPANEQALGRLRVLPGREPHFVYAYNTSISSHISHAHERSVIFRPLAKAFHAIKL